MVVVPHAGVRVDDAGSARAVPQRVLGVEHRLVENQEHGQVLVVALLGAEVKARLRVHVVGSGLVFLHEAVAVVVDDDVVVGRDAVGGVGGNGAVGLDGGLHVAQGRMLKCVHVPDVGTGGLSHGEAVARVVRGAPGEDAHAGVVVVVLDLGVVLIAAAGQDDALLGLEGELVAVCVRGEDAHDLAGHGVLHELGGAGGKTHVSAEARGGLVDRLEQVHARHALAAGDVTALVLLGTLVAVVGLVEPVHLDAVLVEPLRGLVAVLHVAANRLLVGAGAEGAMDVGLIPLVDVDADAGVDVATRSSSGAAVALRGLLEGDDRGALIQAGDGGQCACAAVTHDDEVGLVGPGFRHPVLGRSGLFGKSRGRAPKSRDGGGGACPLDKRSTSKAVGGYVACVHSCTSLFFGSDCSGRTADALRPSPGPSGLVAMERLGTLATIGKATPPLVPDMGSLAKR